ncbi:DUF2177 family protein [Mesobacillus selenatarsenatis]|uniref:DUF2177 domain-containing protein n=1 Tax=Mesobacillus selenatarsenatis (strain DSM 18680 / JCM 14380 / FERM P-15431 / SF-1) TaxID=1321606 RepID=A0A0A8X7Y3_MESS1|nr:DUF2177 family protein [Mesobacillus selenatarsenatis]GAM16060.1 hypothetical protein SAMD00020551_4232 [Mesobacillus selenatarsenatis SF-1]
MKIYGITFLIFLVLDSVWLGLISPSLYKEQIGHLLAPEVNWIAAALFYILFIAGLVYFAVKPAIQGDSWKTAVKNGAFFGLVCYATYDLTNQATIRDWPLMITAIDLMWGTFICGISSLLSFFTARRFVE